MRRLAAALLLVGAAARAASAAAGGSSLDFLRLDIGPRQVGMGGTGVAVGGDAYAGTYNPALLSTLSGQEVAFSHAQWFEDIAYQDFLYAQAAPFGNLSFRFQRLGYGEIARFDAAGARQGDFSASDMLVGAAYARRLPFPGLAAGAAFKSARETIDAVTASAYLFDLGAAWTPRWRAVPGDLTLGAALRNLGPAVKFVSEASPAPTEAVLGAALALGGGAAVIAVDGHLPRESDGYAKLGGEYWLVENLALRAGFEFPQDEGPGIRAGFGLRVGGFQVDYAFLPLGELGLTHHVGFIYRFGSPAEKAFRSGARLLREEKYGEAILRFNEALKLEPRHPRAGQMMRRAYRMLQGRKEGGGER